MDLEEIGLMVLQTWEMVRNSTPTVCQTLFLDSVMVTLHRYALTDSILREYSLLKIIQVRKMPNISTTC